MKRGGNTSNYANVIEGALIQEVSHVRLLFHLINVIYHSESPRRVALKPSSELLGKQPPRGSPEVRDADYRGYGNFREWLLHVEVGEGPALKLTIYQ